MEELKIKLDVELGIEKLHFQPFNTLELKGIYIYDKKNVKILDADRIYANVQLSSFLKKNIVVSALRLNDFTAYLYKEDQQSPLNIQFIIDAFQSDKDEEEPGFDFKVNSLNIINGNIRFDMLDKFYKENVFDENHISISGLNANLVLKSLKKDDLNIQVKRLNLNEKSGLRIKNLITRLTYKENFLQLKGFKLELPGSLIQFTKSEADFSNHNQPGKKLQNFIFSAAIQSSYITPKDISAFVPELKNFNDRIFFKTEIAGSLENLNMSNLTLDYGDKMTLITNASIKNILNREILYLSGEVEKLQITSDGLKGLANNFSGKKEELPQEILSLGTLTFNGNISGQLKKLVAYGNLNTRLGEIHTDLLFGFNPDNNTASYFEGKVHTRDFKLGDFIRNKDFEKLSFDLFVDLKKPVNKNIEGKITGEISHFDFKGYSYQNITANVNYQDTKIDGEVIIDDENVFLDIEGLFDFSQEQPEMIFFARLRNLRPDKLHLSDKYEHTYLSLNIDANFQGKTLDDIEGYIHLDSVYFQRENKSLLIENLLIEASGNSRNRIIDIESNIIRGNITGAYAFSTIINSFKETFNSYLPALIPANITARNGEMENNITIDITIANTEKVSDIFSLPFTIYSEAKILGYYNNLIDKFRLEVFYPSGKAAGMNIKSGYLSAENTGGEIKSKFSGIIIGKNNIQNDITAEISAKNNVVNSTIHFTNNSKQKFKGIFTASASFLKEEDTKAVNTEINIADSELTINDTIWQIEKSKISIDKNSIEINGFNIHNDIHTQSVHIDGKYSIMNPNEILAVSLKNLNLQYIFNTLAIDALEFEGAATGVISASSIEEKPYVNVNLDVNNFGFNNTYLGQLNLFSKLDDETKKVILNGVLLDDEQRKTNIEGFIDPIQQELSVNFEADKINVAFLNKYIESLFNDISGLGSGKVELSGNFSQVTVAGKAFIENGSLGINFLNTRYHFTDTVYLKKDLIYFNDVTFYDEQENKAVISGKVVHDYFSNIMYFVELAGENFMLYNATEKHNPMFYGKVFASGTGSINGDEQVVNINAQLRTAKNTLVRMNFMEETVNEYSFIKYREIPTDSILSPLLVSQDVNGSSQESGFDINMNFYVDATPDATVELVMDPVGGDILRGSGSGALQFVWNANSDPRLYGTYMIEKGSYNFTFQKIIERKFNLQAGSSVLFRGDPFQANLDVIAIYKLNAYLRDLDENLANITRQSTVPVECILEITGELRHPNIGLDVSLPNADPEVQRQVKNLMNTEDMINKQMVYLLLLSKFYTPNYGNVENKSSDLASLASTTLSTQLSKILSTIDDRWQFGANVRTSDAEMKSTEVELLLSSQLLNDRILFNGNFGYREDIETDATFIGDVDIEILLNRSGTWRLKAYNHYNDRYYLRNDINKSTQTQGIGLIYKKNFDYLSEFFGIQEKAKKTQTDSIQAIIPDSTIKGSSLGDFIKIKND